MSRQHPAPSTHRPAPTARPAGPGTHHGQVHAGLPARPHCPAASPAAQACPSARPPTHHGQVHAVLRLVQPDLQRLLLLGQVLDAIQQRLLLAARAAGGHGRTNESVGWCVTSSSSAASWLRGGKGSSTGAAPSRRGSMAAAVRGPHHQPARGPPLRPPGRPATQAAVLPTSRQRASAPVAHLQRLQLVLQLPQLAPHLAQPLLALLVLLLLESLLLHLAIEARARCVA